MAARPHEGFGVVDFSVPAQQFSTLDSLTFQVNEDFSSFAAGGTVDLYLATGTGVTVPYTSPAQ